MLRAGPISMFMHGVLEYAAGVVLIAAPFVFGFDSSAATALSIIIGVFVLAIAASTNGPTGLARVVAVEIHAVVDFALAVLLISAPFLFGFRDEDGATAFFIILGVVHLLLTIATRFRERRLA